MTAHTPKPWGYRIATGTCDTEISRTVQDGGPREAIAIIPYRYGTPEKRAANRSVILAAPDLLDAVEADEYASTLEAHPTSQLQAKVARERATELRTIALAKVRGGR